MTLVEKLKEGLGIKTEDSSDRRKGQRRQDCSNVHSVNVPGQNRRNWQRIRDRRIKN